MSEYDEKRKILREQLRLAKLNNHPVKITEAEAKIALLDELEGSKHADATASEADSVDEFADKWLDYDDMSVSDIRKGVDGVTDVSLLEELLAHEKRNKNRVTAIDAITEQLENAKGDQ